MLAGADQRQPAFLRPVRFEGTVQNRGAQVVGQGPPLTNRKYTGFLSRVIDLGGDIPGGKHLRVIQRLQSVFDFDKTAVVQLKPRVLQPGGPPGVGHPDNLVGVVPVAVRRLELPELNRGHFGVGMQVDIPIGQGLMKMVAHSLAVGG